MLCKSPHTRPLSKSQGGLRPRARRLRKSSSSLSSRPIHHQTDHISVSQSVMTKPIRSFGAVTGRTATNPEVQVLSVQVTNSLSGALSPLTISPKRSQLQGTTDPDGVPSFRPGVSNALTWYVCGPTVYDSSHIGHARTYVCFDLMRRTLKDRFMTPMVYAMGVTDIDDKIITRSRERGVSWIELARKYEAEFNDDLQSLNVLPPDISLRVSEFIPDIISYVEVLSRRGFTYSTADGLYFDVQEFTKQGFLYGKLRFPSMEAAANQVREALTQRDASLFDEEVIPGVPSGGSTVSAQENSTQNTNGNLAPIGAAEKRHPADFCLWKFQKEPDEPAFPSSLGLGRPGWHIECSAMTAAALGTHLDVHGGGVDLRFPHHCNEIAQAEAALGWGGGDFDTFSPHSQKDTNPGHLHTPDEHKCGAMKSQWVSTWIHTGHLHIKGLKMSKSLKNFISIQGFFEQGGTADEFRMMCTTSAYNTVLDFTPQRLAVAQGDISAIANFLQLVTRTVQQTDHAASQSATSTASLSRLLAPVTVIRPAQPEEGLQTALIAAQAAVNTALANDFQFAQAQLVIGALMSQTIKYIDTFKSLETRPSTHLLTAVTSYIVSHYSMLGFEFAGGGIPNHSWRSMTQLPSLLAQPAGESQVEVDSAGIPLHLHSLAAQRTQLKSVAVSTSGVLKKLKATQKDSTKFEVVGDSVHIDQTLFNLMVKQLGDNQQAIMASCDKIRDEVFPQQSFALTDTVSSSTAAPGALPYFINPVLKR